MRVVRWVFIAVVLCALPACGDRDRGDAADTSRDASPSLSARSSPRPTGTVRGSTGARKTPGATPFDEEAWRRETIERFGPERKFADGSKEDYVEQAEALCAAEDRPDYEEDSIQRWMEESFCPHAD